MTLSLVVGKDGPALRFTGQQTAVSDATFYHVNHQGSVVALSNSQGEVESVKTYDTYGVPIDSKPDRFGYTGQIYLEKADLYYYKARLYKPEIGRFLQTDPIGYEDQMNLYAYVHNDPINHTDPTGEAACGGFCVGAGLFALYRGYKTYRAVRTVTTATAAAAAANEVYNERLITRIDLLMVYQSKTARQLSFQEKPVVVTKYPAK